MDTCQTRMMLSEQGAERDSPSADQANETHCGTNRDFGEVTSALSSSTMILCSKSQILMELLVAAHSQYLFGEKQRAFMLSPLSKVYKCLLSFKSQSIAW